MMKSSPDSEHETNFVAQDSQWDVEVWQIGGKYFIRAVTYFLTGELVKLTDQELVLKSAAWIADTGRFMQAVESGDFAEVEPFPIDRPVIVNRGAIVDAVTIPNLPQRQK